MIEKKENDKENTVQVVMEKIPVSPEKEEKGTKPSAACTAWDAAHFEVATNLAPILQSLKENHPQRATLAVTKEISNHNSSRSPEDTKPSPPIAPSPC